MKMRSPAGASSSGVVFGPSHFPGGDPLGMFLRDEAFDSVSQKRDAVLGLGVRPCSCEEEKLLVLQRLCVRAVERPVLLILVQLLEPLHDHNQSAQNCGDRWIGAEVATTGIAAAEMS